MASITAVIAPPAAIAVIFADNHVPPGYQWGWLAALGLPLGLAGWLRRGRHKLSGGMRIIDHAAQTAFDVLTTRRDILDHMARELVEKEVMDAEQIHRIIDEHKTAPQLKPGTTIPLPVLPAEMADSDDLSDNSPPTLSAESGA